jgi:glycosyltransferase involved in cell wall biosynthesis
MRNWRSARLSAIRLGMLSVLIETRNDEEGLARTLASLIGGAVEGVVRDVIVCDAGSTDQTHRVAEHAGCHYVAGSIATGIGQAKGDWLLFLEPGARLAEGWIDEVVAHTARQTMPARFARTRANRTPFLARVFSGKRTLAEGLVISKRQAAALAKSARSAEALARGLATRKLNAEIWVAPPK